MVTADITGFIIQGLSVIGTIKNESPSKFSQGNNSTSRIHAGIYMPLSGKYFKSNMIQLC